MYRATSTHFPVSRISLKLYFYICRCERELPMENTAGAFQSILQLSVALNLGFVGYLTIGGDKLKREKGNVDSLFLSAVALNNMMQDRDEMIRVKAGGLLLESIQIKGEFSQAFAKVDSVVEGRSRGTLLFSGILSFCMLLYATFFGSEFVNNLFFIFCLAVYGPFFIILSFHVWLSNRSAKILRAKRMAVDDQMAKLIMDHAS